jgi:3-hydroxy-9,10-secoandrosta-1,3,5(10)-triene-9,17-dione monooxygenase reductase component
MDNPLPFDRHEFRRTLGTFATGVTVITILDAEANPHGMTVNSFSSVSLEPPLILWSLALDTPDAAAFQQATWFAVNILAEAQVALSNRFADPALSMTERFAGVASRPGLGGVPRLDGCAAVLECRRELCYPGGDHVILVGRVERLHRSAQPPLLFWNGAYAVIARRLEPA